MFKVYSDQAGFDGLITVCDSMPTAIREAALWFQKTGMICYVVEKSQ